MLENIDAIVDYTLGQREGMDGWEGRAVSGREELRGCSGLEDAVSREALEKNYINILFTETLQ